MKPGDLIFYSGRGDTIIGNGGDMPVIWCMLRFFWEDSRGARPLLLGEGREWCKFSMIIGSNRQFITM